jgi:hydroxyacylglutathione hydrolase
MNKTIKWTLIVTTSLIVIFVLAMGGYYFKMKSEISKMHVTETKEVVHNVFAVKDSFVNMFLVKDSDNYVVVDAGEDINVIRAELAKLNIDPAKVVAVFLTHSDADHTAAIPLFKNAKVYLSHQEEQMINGKTARTLVFHNKIATPNYTLLDDQQMLTVGKTTIKGILTPGHTPGSMCYVINSKYLFVGDAFALNNGKIDKPNKFFSMDMKTAIQSFGKISNLPLVECIFTAHTGYSVDYRNAVKTELK